MAVSSYRSIAVHQDTCLECGFCEQFVDCARRQTGCIGCGACLKGCPQGAIRLQERRERGDAVRFSVDGDRFEAEGPLSILAALKYAGRSPVDRQGSPDAEADLCATGGCWACAVVANGELVRSCITPLEREMAIITDPEVIRRTPPRRLVTLMRPAPHYHPSIFTQGCNFSCDLCHNWDMTFASTGSALTPEETVVRLNLDLEKDYWVGISGGEPTLNRPWLIQTIRYLRQKAPEIRIQLDSNASLLTPDYIDELAASGVTDLSPDLKAARPETFMKVCGIASQQTAQRYMDTAWQAVAYLNDVYREQIFTAVSVPCHPRIHSMNELEETARRLAAINPAMAVTLIEYQPAFRLRDWPRVSRKGMDMVHKLFVAAGLKRVVIQGGDQVPRAVDPMDLALGSEEF